MGLGTVSWWAAFTAGLLSFFTPCILPMIPAYIMYVTGAALEDDMKAMRLRAFTRTLGFVLGFTVIFMIMGLTATYIGRAFQVNRDLFRYVSGTIIILFGLSLTGLIRLSFLQKGIHVKAPKKMTGWFSAVIMGMAFAAAWTPCAGPVLGSVLFMAGGSATATAGTLLLLVYSLGMAVPFLLTAIFMSYFLKWLGHIERWAPVAMKVGGWLLVLFGLLIIFDKVVVISRWMIG